MQDHQKARSLFHSEVFARFICKKKGFVVPILIFLMFFYFCLPLSVWFFPEQMTAAVPWLAMPWGWLYAFSQFIMTWALGWVYWRKAKAFDRFAERLDVKEQ